MPVEIIPKLVLGCDNCYAALMEHPQQPSQPLPMDSQPGQPRHDHDVHQTCAHCPQQDKQPRPPDAVPSASVLTGANDLEPLLLSRLERIQFLFRQLVAIP